MTIPPGDLILALGLAAIMGALIVLVIRHRGK
jgi:hypothetical protein